MPSNVRREVITREFYPDGSSTSGGGYMNKLAAQGNRGDTQLAHVNPWEALLLKRLGGAGTTNPKTGLPQFYWDASKTNWTDEGTSAVAPQGWDANYYLQMNPDVANDPSWGSRPLEHWLAQGQNEPRVYQRPESGGNLLGLGEGFNFDFPTDLKQTSESSSQSQNYSGLPTNYQEQLLSSLIPRLTGAVTNMESNIDKYTGEALSSYEQQRQNAIRKGLPQAIAGLANRGIINSTQGNEVMAKVLSDAATAASDKGYQTAMQAALLKANMPTVLAQIADLGKYTSGSMESKSYSEDPTQMYQILAQLLMAQF